MSKFYIYERVPQYIEYRKIVEADSLEAAQAMCYADVDAEEQRLDDGEVIETLPVLYEAEPVEG